MLVSIVIRTLNEELHLPELLVAIRSQRIDSFKKEVVIVDSGSSDNTLDIAKDFGCRITYIEKTDFSFGRSLNIGSEFANGDIIIFISGHCIPCDSEWLNDLIKPIQNGVAEYVYGRQIGRDTTKFSEKKIFDKYFPAQSRLPQKGFFCNNANSAIQRKAWLDNKFDENLTGLEDMELAKRICNLGCKVAYSSEACVYHIHDESWLQVSRRYEREAIALQQIMPEVHIHFMDMVRYVFASISGDIKAALQERCLVKEMMGIVKFRIAQYTGTYKGNHEHRSLSNKRKENYFYPTKIMKD